MRRKSLTDHVYLRDTIEEYKNLIEKAVTSMPCQACWPKSDVDPLAWSCASGHSTTP